MQIKQSEFAQFLKEGFRTVYVLCGSEPVLINEAAELIHAAAKSEGVEEFETLRFADQGIKLKNNPPWSAVFDELSESSLFGGRKLIEVRIGIAALDDASLDKLKTFAEGSADNMLVIRLVDELTSQRKRGGWYRFLRNDPNCVLFVADSLTNDQSVRWAQGKAKRLDLELQSDAAEKLADLCEGNLLAVQQALEVIQLIHDKGATIEVNDIDVADTSNAEVREVVDAACFGRADQVGKILDRLDNQQPGSGSYELFVLNSLSNTLTNAHAVAVNEQANVPGYLRRLVNPLVGRHGRLGLEKLLVGCSRLNSTLLGMARGEGALLIRALLFEVAGSGSTRFDKEYLWREIDRRLAN